MSINVRRAFVKRFIVLALAPLGLGEYSQAQAADLIVSAASSLTNAFTALGQSFETTHPGIKVLLNFGASDALMMQIINGAPADVFASADQVAMDKAVALKGVVGTSRQDFALNQVVVIAPSDGELQVTELKDLASPSFKRVTFGNPASVPIGRYAQAALEAAGQWDVVSAKAILAQNVRQSLDYVVRGEVDAGFVFATDAALAGDRVRVTYRVTSAMPASYPIAVTSTTRQPDIAQEFVDYVVSPAGQSVLAKYGFLKP